MRLALKVQPSPTWDVGLTTPPLCAQMAPSLPHGLPHGLTLHFPFPNLHFSLSLSRVVSGLLSGVDILGGRKSLEADAPCHLFIYRFMLCYRPSPRLLIRLVLSACSLVAVKFGCTQSGMRVLLESSRSWMKGESPDDVHHCGMMLAPLCT